MSQKQEPLKGLPDSEIYEQELEYWPYKKSWNMVFDYICKNSPENGSLLDLMCGPGYLLGKIAEKRPDLNLKGIDIDERYIPFAKEKYPHIDFELNDIFSLSEKNKYDVVICTGSVHHLPYEKQEDGIKIMASLVKPEGFVLISDCYVDDYSNETERKLAAAKLGYEYLKGTIENQAPDPVIEPTIEILYNDVFIKEFKTSIKKRFPIFQKLFKRVETMKAWPDFVSEYGDYITICKNI